MSVVLTPCGHRSVLLIQRAYEGEGRACPDIDERRAPMKQLYPRSFVTTVEAMPGEKVHDYRFIGSVYRPETYANRAWIIDHVKQRFTDRSYFLATDRNAPHVEIARRAQPEVAGTQHADVVAVQMGATRG